MIRFIAPLIAALFLMACGSDAGPEFESPGNTQNVVLKTDMGDIHIELFTEKAPNSTRDFLNYVEGGIFDFNAEDATLNSGFYRVVRPDNDNRNMGMSIIQGGMLSLETYTPFVEHESTEMTGFSNIEGSVALARDTVGTGNAAYFYICLLYTSPSPRDA